LVQHRVAGSGEINTASCPSRLSAFVGMSRNEGQQYLHGPHVVIDGVRLEAKRLTLTPAEVAQVMRLQEPDVCNMIKRGELRDVSCDARRRLDPDEVIEAVEERVRRGELGAHVFVELAALIGGRL